MKKLVLTSTEELGCEINIEFIFEDDVTWMEILTTLTEYGLPALGYVMHEKKRERLIDVINS